MTARLPIEVQVELDGTIRGPDRSVGEVLAQVEDAHAVDITINGVSIFPPFPSVGNLGAVAHYRNAILDNVMAHLNPEEVADVVAEDVCE